MDGKMTSNYFDYYDGSRIFLFISNRIGISIDLVNFLISQVAALCLGRLFRKPLRLASPEFRHSLCLVIGLAIGYFCFGKQAVHLSVLPMLCYTLLKTVNYQIMGNAVLAVAMFYLSCLHLHRQIYHTADYTLDITGPLMVITQRVTSLTYSLQDSLIKSENDINKRGEKKVSSVDKIPSPLEFFAYALSFQALISGPAILYADYINFIEGNNFYREDAEKTSVREPSPRRAVLFKVAGSLAAAVSYLTLSKKYPITLLEELTDPKSEVSQNWSALYLLWYAYLSTLVVRCKYYHAWLFSEAICNNSGIGFNGYDADGTPKWDKMTNIDVFGFECAQNFHSAIASWNKSTNRWLRCVAYERGGGVAGGGAGGGSGVAGGGGGAGSEGGGARAAWRTARVYTLSALWHGFQPGYYLTFLVGGLFTVAAKRVRKVIRPVFLENRTKKFFYDIISFVTTRVAMTYATVPFVILNLAPSLAFYGKFYYSLHFIAIGALLMPLKSSRKEHCELPKESTQTQTDSVSVNGTTVETNGKYKSKLQ